MYMQLDYLEDKWDDTLAASMDEPELLRYRSNLLGSDPRLTNFGGGNTSAKISGVDPITGSTVDVLWVNGSGGDLGTIGRGRLAPEYERVAFALPPGQVSPVVETEFGFHLGKRLP